MGGYGQRVGFLIYSSGGKVFAGADKFYVVAGGVGGSCGMEVKLILTGEPQDWDAKGRKSLWTVGHGVE